jgi:hypothetical protein
MARARKPLLVPVSLAGGGIMHDTLCARGAESIEDAAHIDNACFDQSGHMRWGADYVMAEVKPFRASLRVIKYYHYKSSVHVELMDVDGVRYPMFLGDLVPMLETANVVNGWIEARTYEPCKRSTAYGIRPVKN